MRKILKSIKYGFLNTLMIGVFTIIIMGVVRGFVYLSLNYGIVITIAIAVVLTTMLISLMKYLILYDEEEEQKHLEEMINNQEDDD